MSEGKNKGSPLHSMQKRKGSTARAVWQSLNYAACSAIVLSGFWVYGKFATGEFGSKSAALSPQAELHPAPPARPSKAPPAAAPPLPQSDAALRTKIKDQELALQDLRRRVARMEARRPPSPPAESKLETKVSEASFRLTLPDDEESSRCVVYVLDATGSMAYVMPDVQTAVLDSVKTLKPSQKFNIIAVNNGKITAMSSVSLPGGTESLDSATKFLSSVRAYGNGSVAPALESAYLLRPSVIWFLTNAELFADDKAAALRNLFGHDRGNAKVFTTLAWPQDLSDQSIFFLRRIAASSGGICFNSDGRPVDEKALRSTDFSLESDNGRGAGSKLFRDY